MHVKIVYTESGRGLLKDCELLQAILESRGHSVCIQPIAPPSSIRLKLNRKWHRLLSKKLPPRTGNALLKLQLQTRLLLNGRGSHDLVIHLQSIQPRHLHNNGTQWLIPNQEWFSLEQMHYLARIDTVVSKTREACSLFSRHHRNVVFTGFSSPLVAGRLSIPKKDFNKVLHVAGNSPFKGTDALIRVWRQHPEWPTLTVVSNRHPQEQLPDNIKVLSNVPQDELTELWSKAGLAVLPSEVEGYGQVLVEAQAYGCVVVTTDAPPMNEVVTPNGGILTPYASTAKFRMGTRYFVDETALEHVIMRYFKTDPERLQEMSESTFRQANDNHKSFESRLTNLVQHQGSYC